MKPHEIKTLARKTLSDKPSKIGDAGDMLPPDGEVEHMSIRPDSLNGQDGFMAEHRLQGKLTKGNEGSPMPPTEKHFFQKSDSEGLGNHVKKVFGGKK